MRTLIKENILLISKNIFANTKGGREQLSASHYKILKDIYSNNLYCFDAAQKPILSWVYWFISIISGYLDGLTRSKCFEILNIIQYSSITQVFINGSNYGQLAKFLNKYAPEVEIICFFHNVESKFFWDSFSHHKTLKSFLTFSLNYFAERSAVKYSHKIITLSKRDSDLLLRLFGRSSTHILPMILEEYHNNKIVTELPKRNFSIFVGGSFYANISGIRWYIHNVASKVNEDLYILGKGLEEYKVEFEEFKNVYVIGYVENLEPWYEAASYSVAPIFGGSGMKTKVAESLMFGKIIIGTHEAFAGYEEISSIAGSICSSPEEFIATINRKVFPGSATDRRKAYEENYSLQAGKIQLLQILQN